VADSYRLSAEVLHQYGQRLLVHVGGPIRHLLTPMTEVGVDGPPQGDMSLAQAREIVGRQVTLWGGIPQDFLLDMHDRQEFEATVIQAVQEAKSDSRMILGVADRVPVDANLSRLEALPALVEQALSG
jgi:uroporphyrinogen-III decarboxylase